MRTTRAVVYAVGVGLALAACSSGGGLGTVDGEGLKLGDCFNQSDAQVESAKFDLVPCTDEHQGEVYIVRSGMNVPDDFSDRMISEWETYTGLTYDTATAYVNIVSWALGGTSDPHLVVASYAADGPSTGSIRAN